MKRLLCEINKNGTVAVDDTILIKDYPATAGSLMLKDFKPLFNAEVVDRLLNAGYVIKGKSNVGEFGLDLLGETSYFGEVVKDGLLVGASADLVNDGEVSISLSVDLNGSPRRSAAVSNVIFIKPTYGTVSRYGIVPCACSGEQVGVTAKTVDECRKALSVISGHDEKDGTSLKEEKYDYSSKIDLKGKKICLIKELYEDADEKVKNNINKSVEILKASGSEVEIISYKELILAQTAWQILLSAETCNNISRYDGVKFGYRTPAYSDIDELYVNSRTEAFNILTKNTVLYGSDVLSKGKYFDCYDKSLKIRRIILDGLKDLFTKYDAILSAPCSTYEFKKYNLNDAFINVFNESKYTAFSSISGLPSLICGGVQFTANSFNENLLFSLADVIEK